MTNAKLVNDTNAVINLSCKKHMKIYKLKQLGLTNKQIASELKTNSGHVYNALKKYNDKPELKEKADSVIAM